MASLADLFNPSFLMFLGILVLALALLVVYYESKMRDQNHKIASMLSLVSTLAEDMNGVKMGINHLAMTSFSGGSSKQFFQQQHLEEDEEDGEEDEEDEITSKDNKLIHVSDDDRSENSDNSQSGLQLNSDSDSDSDDSDSDDSDSDDSEPDYEDNENVEELFEEEDFTNHNDIKVLKLNIASELFENEDVIKEELEDLEVLEDNLSYSQSVNLESNNDLPGENDDNNLLASNLKSININLEETESLDYKKLSLPKLRSIVSEKGLSSDSSKLKKQELLKLLEVE
jgi:hypothetical protein